MEASAAGRPLSLRATGKARRRLMVSRGVEGVTALAAAGALAVLGWVIISVLLKGLPALNLDFFTKNAPTFNPTGTTHGGGIESALIGTPIMVAIGTAMALPVGVLIA